MGLKQYRNDYGLALILISTAVFYFYGNELLSNLNNLLQTAPVFIWLFAIMMWSAFGVVRHADHLAVKLGEPYGTLILTLSAVSIEVTMVSAVMLNATNNPTIGRDTMFAVLMIVLNGMVGLSIFLGGLRHIQQEFNLQGANTFLSVLIPLSAIGLILPNYTRSTEVGTLSPFQMTFAIITTVSLYAAFLGIQTTRHKKFFMAPLENNDKANSGHQKQSSIATRSIPFHTSLLIVYMICIVILSEKMAVIVDYSFAGMGAPEALGGLLVAVLVLTPEGIAALKAALANHLQRSVNVCLGSALSTIGLTVPAIYFISIVTGRKVILGIGPIESLLLILTLAVSMVNFSSLKSNIIQGAIHLILFATYIVLIFD